MKKLLEKYPVLKALDEAFKEQRLRIFVLLYISPITPFNDIGYWMNNFHSTFRHSSLTLITILPGAVLYCFIGATAGSLTESENAADGPAAIASIMVGSVFGLLAVFAVSYYAKKEFNKIVAEQEKHENEEDGFSAEDPQTKEEQVPT